MAIFTSETRAEVLRLLFDGLGQEYYLRELERLTSTGIKSLQKEVKHLQSHELLKQRVDGNRTYYCANTEHPIFTDLVSMVEKTVGIVAQLKERLADSRIRSSFLFGSFASGTEKSTSDIDIIIIGDLGMRAVSKLLSGIQEKINREINPHVFSHQEFSKRVKEKDHFITSILQEKISPIIGDISEYR